MARFSYQNSICRSFFKFNIRFSSSTFVLFKSDISSSFQVQHSFSSCWTFEVCLKFDIRFSSSTLVLFMFDVRSLHVRPTCVSLKIDICFSSSTFVLFKRDGKNFNKTNVELEKSMSIFNKRMSALKNEHEYVPIFRTFHVIEGLNARSDCENNAALRKFHVIKHQTLVTRLRSMHSDHS